MPKHNPEYDRMYRRETRKQYRGHAYRSFVPAVPKIDESQLSRLLAEIPVEDTRSLTAMIMGDPNPADRRRSA